MNTYEFSADTRAFLESIPIPLAVYQYIDNQIRPLAVSRAYLELFGYSSCEEAVYGLGTNLYRNVHPDDIARIPTALPRIRRVITILFSGTKGRIRVHTV